MSAAEVLRMPERARTEFVSLFEDAPLGIALCDKDGNVTSTNPALDQILGTPSQLMDLALRLPDLVHPEDRSEMERQCAELFDGKQDHFQMEAKTIAGGAPIQWKAWKIHGNGEGSDAALAIAEPLATEGQERLRQAQRLETVGRLAGGVAHDFNNLLTGVLLYCDLLIASLEPEHRARKYAEEIRKAGFQASGVVRQLLAVARPTNCPPRLLSLNETAEGMRNLLTRLSGEQIEIDLRLDPNLGLVRMDPTQPQQILLNLVLNARDAMPLGGQITVETGNCSVQILPENMYAVPRSLRCALLVVADNGHGMDDSTRERIFEPFFTTKGKGTGLGLATVQDIVAKNGGLISVESALAQGTRVTVLLPIAVQEELDSSNNPDSYPASSGEPDLSQKRNKQP